MSTYYGIVQDNVVVLPPGVRLLEGLKVRIQVLWPKPRRMQRRSTETEFKQRLLETGVLAEIREPSPSWIREDYTPIQVQGKSLSQMIVEERR